MWLYLSVPPFNFEFKETTSRVCFLLSYQTQMTQDTQLDMHKMEYLSFLFFILFCVCA